MIHKKSEKKKKKKPQRNRVLLEKAYIIKTDLKEKNKRINNHATKINLPSKLICSVAGRERLLLALRLEIDDLHLWVLTLVRFLLGTGRHLGSAVTPEE